MAKPKHILIAVSEEEYKELKTAKKEHKWRDVLFKGAEAIQKNLLKEAEE